MAGMGVARTGSKWADGGRRACGALWLAARDCSRRLSSDVPSSGSKSVGFADDDQDERQKLQTLERSILEQHAPSHLSTMFNLEPPSTDADPGAAHSAAQNTDGPARFAWLRQTQQGGSMGEQRRKAWQKFPDAHSGSVVVPRPRRIILIRHAESLGNVDELVYTTTPDWKIPLTERGVRQADDIGVALRSLIGDGNVYIYHSPYVRTAQTCQQILLQLPQHQIKAVRYERGGCWLGREGARGSRWMAYGLGFL